MRRHAAARPDAAGDDAARGDPQQPAPPAPNAAACVIVTRPQPQADAWVARLAVLGVASRALPLLAIIAPTDLRPVHVAWERVADFDFVMFVSPSAVDRFFALRPLDRRWPATVRAGSTGAGTSQALLQAGVPPGCVVTPPVEGGQFDSEALWRQMRRLRDWRGARVLIVRGEGGRDWLADTLREQGAQVDFVEAYRRGAPVLDAPQRLVLAEALAQPRRYLWLFSSSEAVGHLPALAPGADWAASRAAATHARIAQAARDIGFGRVDRIAPSPEAVAAHIRGSIQSAGP